MTNRHVIRALRVTLAAAAGLIALLAPGRASAQATHTWISGVGDDVNPCSRTAPCRTSAGAISKTAAGGEIGALDPGTFGGVTITKAITIDGNGSEASTVASGTYGITVNVATAGHVVLRNLSINGIGDGASPGLSGVRFLAGESLTIEHSVIANFSNYGVDHTSPGTLLLHETIIRNAAAGAVRVEAASGAPRTSSCSTPASRTAPSGCISSAPGSRRCGARTVASTPGRAFGPTARTSIWGSSAIRRP